MDNPHKSAQIAGLSVCLLAIFGIAVAINAQRLLGPAILVAMAGSAFALCALSRWVATEDSEGSTNTTWLFAKFFWPSLIAFLVMVGAFITLAVRG